MGRFRSSVFLWERGVFVVADFAFLTFKIFYMHRKLF